MTPENQKMIDELKRLMAEATPRPWRWSVEDYSVAIIQGPKGEEDHVLSCSPCESCQKHAKKSARPDEYPEWEWGRCTTPNQTDAALIIAMRNAIPALLEEVEKGWERGVRDAAEAVFTVDNSDSYHATRSDFEAAILALLPPAPASDDARER